MTDISHLNRQQRRSAIHQAKQRQKLDNFAVHKERLDRQREARCRTEAYFEKQRNSNIVNTERDRTWWIVRCAEDLFNRHINSQDFLVALVLFGLGLCVFLLVSMQQTQWSRFSPQVEGDDGWRCEDV